MALVSQDGSPQNGRHFVRGTHGRKGRETRVEEGNTILKQIV